MAKEEKTATMWTEELLEDYFYILDQAYQDPNVDAEISADEKSEMDSPGSTKEDEDED